MVASITRHSEVNQLAELNPKHYRELVQKRGLNPDWAAVNCKSVDAKTASEHLGYKAQSDGILLSGNSFQEQFRPDQPWPSQDGKTPPKYRSSKDEDGYDAMLPKHPSKKSWWVVEQALKDSSCWVIDGVPCLIITEGFFKAICLCSHGFRTIAILGVEQGLTSGKRDPQGKRYLVDVLERFAKAGFGFIIGFDADAYKKDKHGRYPIREAQEKLAHQLSLFGVPVYSITGLWHEAEGKGIDDYIQMNSFEEFRDKILAKAETIEQWKEKHLDNLEKQVNQDSKTKPPTPRKTAQEITEDYRDKWRYHNQQKTWRQWNGKCWESVDDGVLEVPSNPK
jgi:putative DNA primase/helicase